MKLGKLIPVIIAVFTTFFLTNFLIHGMILKNLYHSTAPLWRPEGEMHQYAPVMLLGQFTVSAFFSWIFMHGYKGKGWPEGVRYGALMTGFMAGHHLIMYCVEPYTPALVASWIALGLLQAMLAGAVAAIVARRAG